MERSYLTGAIMFALSFFVFTGLQAGQDKEMPPAEAEGFWTYITETDAYEQWEFFPGYDGMFPGQSPHGAYLKLYANDIAVEAASKGEPMPEGAILVKENYGENQTDLMAITPIYKKRGYNPEEGDWFWAKYDPDGSVESSGKVDGCIQCHQTQDDFLFSKPK